MSTLIDLNKLSGLGLTTDELLETSSLYFNQTPDYKVEERTVGSNIETVLTDVSPFEKEKDTIIDVRPADDSWEDTLVTATPERSFWELADIAFQQENTVGSFFANDTPSVEQEVVEGYDVFSDIQGYEDYADSFVGVYDPTQTKHIKKRIDEELANKEILASQPLKGLAASMLVAIADPVDIVAAGLSGGGALLLKGKKVTTAVSAAVGGTIATETALHATQETRTTMESALAIGGSGLITGGATAALLRYSKGFAPKGIDIDDTADEFIRKMGKSDEDITAMPNDGMFDSPRSIGAAETIFKGNADANTLKGDKWFRAGDFDIGGSALSKLGMLGGTRMTPLARMAGSVSPTSRNVIHQLAENSFVTKGVEAGKAKPVAVETLVNMYQDRSLVKSKMIENSAIKEIHSLGWTTRELSYVDSKTGQQIVRKASDDDFYNDVGLAMRTGDNISNAITARLTKGDYTPEQIQVINNTAKKFREVYDEFKDEAIELGLLPPELKDNISYLNRVYDQKALADNGAQFQKILANHFLRKSEDTAELGYKIRDTLSNAFTEGNVGSIAGRYYDDLVSGEVTRNGTEDLVDSIARREVSIEDLGTVTPEQVKIQNIEDLNNIVTSLKDDLGKIDDPELKKLVDDIDYLSDSTSDYRKSVKELTKQIHELRLYSNQKQSAILTEDEAMKVAIKSQQNITGNGFLYSSSTMNWNGLNEAKVGAFKGRVLDIDDSEIADFLVNDVRASLTAHVMNVIPQIKFLKQMRKVGFGDEDLNLSKTKASIKNEYQSIIDELQVNSIINGLRNGVPRGKLFSEQASKLISDKARAEIESKVTLPKSWFTKGKTAVLKDEITDDMVMEAFKPANRTVTKWTKKYNTIADSNLKDLEVIRERILNTRGRQSDPSSLANRSLKGMRDLNYVTLLGGQTLTAATDIARPLMQYGFGPVIKQLFKGQSSTAHALKGLAKKDYIDEMNRAGIVAENVLNTRSQQVSDIINGAYDQGKFAQFSNKATAAFSKWTFMSTWNEGMKHFSVGIAQDIILDAAEKAAKGNWSSVKSFYQQRLAVMGFDVNDLIKINQQYKKYGNKETGVREAVAGDWDDIELSEKYLAALRKEADTTIVSVGAGDKPLWADSMEVAKNIYQFQSFGLAMVNRGMINGMQTGVIRYLAWATLSMALAGTAITAKDAVRGKDSSLKKKVEDGDYEALAADIVDRSGILPTWNYALRGLNSMDVFTTSRFQQQGAIQTFAGPSLGLIEDVGSTVGKSVKSVKATATSEDEEKALVSAYKSVKRFMPFQNHPVVQYLEGVGLEAADMEEYK